MRAVFINHCHPATPHVCALRMKSFAEAMAGRGHQIVLLTQTLKASDPGQDARNLPEDLKNHDWTKPYYLAIKPTEDAALDRLHGGRLPFGVRQLVIALRYFRDSGVFGNWQLGAKAALPVLAEHFAPDVVWATFGNTDSWAIAKDLSKAADCPWVGDLKDNWSAFLPTGFKCLIANRFKDAARMTAFSGAHQSEVKRWFSKDASIIYSGFDQARPAPEVMADGLRILLTGSLYDEAPAAELIKGIAGWLRGRRSGAPPVEFTYAGADGARAEALAAPLKGLCRVRIDGFLPIDHLRARQAGAWVNTYMYRERALFQHKPLELLAAGRPIMAFPGESSEVLGIARAAEGTFQTCASAGQVATYLETLDPTPERRPASDKVDDKINAYSWQGQAEALEHVLDQARGRS